MKSIHIIGGGLAGLSLGICLRKKGIPVTIHEKKNYPQHKVCGEFISGITTEILSTLGIYSLFSDALRHHTINWWMGHNQLLTETLPTPAWGISRYTLDQRLADKFQHLGGQLHTGKRFPMNETTDHPCVWAIGKPINPSKAKPNWIGLKIHALNTQIQGLHMHSSTSQNKGGYVGLAQVENDRVNCCGLFHLRTNIKPSKAKTKWNNPAAMLIEYAEACGMHQLLELLHSWEFDPQSFTTTAGFSLGHQTTQHGFSIGDAAWLIPPFTGNGMSMAMESSAIAAEWLEKYAQGTISWSESEQGFRHATQKHFSRRMKVSKLIHPLFFNALGQQLLKTSSKTHTLPFQYIFNLLRKP